jgi:hypothetical protein
MVEKDGGVLPSTDPAGDAVEDFIPLKNVAFTSCFPTRITLERKVLDSISLLLLDGGDLDVPSKAIANSYLRSTNYVVMSRHTIGFPS